MNIEQAVSAAVAGLQLENTFTFDDLRDTVQDRRHRRLRIVELADLDAHDGLCAALISTDAEDFVLHELSHMILGHCDGDDCAVDEALLPNIPPYTRGRLLRRQDLDSETEIAAESLADRLAAGIRGAVFAESAYSEVFG